jgi:hypothetical protein
MDDVRIFSASFLPVLWEGVGGRLFLSTHIKSPSLRVMPGMKR